MCGALLAIGYHLTFQLPAEDARIMAGLIDYPRNNVYFLLRTNAWSLMNQLGAAALKLGVTEETLNIAFCALGGAFSFTSLGLISLAWSNNIFISLLLPLFMYVIGLVGLPSANYPIFLMGTIYTQGIIGMFFGLLAMGFASCGRLKTAALVAGIAVSVHPTLGLFYLLSFALFLLAVRSTLPTTETEAICKALATGILISLSSLIIQKLYFAVKLPAADSETVRVLLHKCLQNFSWHRSPDSKKWFTGATTVAMIPAVLALIELRQKSNPEKRRYAATAVCAITVTALCFVTTDSLVGSDYFDLIMSWRYFNILNVCCIPVTFGILGYSGHSRDWQGLALLIGLVSLAALIRDTDPVIGYVSFGLSAGWVLFARERIASTRLTRIKNSLAGACLAGAVAWVIFPAALAVLQQNFDKSIFINYKHTAEYTLLSNRPGTLLISSASGLLQQQLRRPVLIGPNDLESHLYLPGTLPAFNHILSTVYGLDLMTATPNSPIHNCWMTREHRTLWESRPPAEWRELKREFGITDVATPPNWSLKLPVVMATPDFALYEIP